MNLAGMNLGIKGLHMMCNDIDLICQKTRELLVYLKW